MKFCTNCGHELQDGMMICPNCGNVIAQPQSGFEFKALLDETNPIWFKIAKITLQVCTVIILLSGLIMFFNLAQWDAGAGFLYLLVCVLVAVVEYVVGMIGLQFLSNVTAIRNMLEEKRDK